MATGGGVCMVGGTHSSRRAEQATSTGYGVDKARICEIERTPDAVARTRACASIGAQGCIVEAAGEFPEIQDRSGSI
jgi:hypothetical protein